MKEHQSLSNAQKMEKSSQVTEWIEGNIHQVTRTKLAPPEQHLNDSI